MNLIPEHMKNTQTQDSLRSLLEVMRESFTFAIAFAKTSMKSKSYDHRSAAVLMHVCSLRGYAGASTRHCCKLNQAA